MSYRQHSICSCSNGYVVRPCIGNSMGRCEWPYLQYWVSDHTGGSHDGATRCVLARSSAAQAPLACPGKILSPRGFLLLAERLRLAESLDAVVVATSTYGRRCGGRRAQTGFLSFVVPKRMFVYRRCFGPGFGPCRRRRQPLRGPKSGGPTGLSLHQQRGDYASNVGERSYPRTRR